MAEKKVNSFSAGSVREQVANTVFVDQPCSFQAGPYVTKLTFGVDENDGTEEPRAVLTIAMPTINMMRMVEDLQKLFNDPDFKSYNLNVLTEDFKSVYGVEDLVAKNTALKRKKIAPN